MTMTREEAVDFGKYSAFTAIDQGEVDNYRDNVIDTLNEHKSSEWEFDALQAFDKELARLTA